MKYSNDLTQEYLKSILHYDPETGIFTWVTSRSKVQAGEIAGSLNDKGYIKIKIDWKKYSAHRLAVLYMTGVWPIEQVDHEDLDKSNNKWSNLREATNAKNKLNITERIDNKLGIKGVYNYRGRFRAQIQINGEKIFLGSYSTKEEAKLAHDKAAVKYAKEFARWTSNGTP